MSRSERIAVLAKSMERAQDYGDSALMYRPCNIDASVDFTTDAAHHANRALDLIEAMVRAERERCAEIAEDDGDESQRRYGAAGSVAAYRIAQRIRAEADRLEAGQ